MLKEIKTGFRTIFPGGIWGLLGRSPDWASPELKSFLYSTEFYLDKESSYFHHLFIKPSRFVFHKHVKVRQATTFLLLFLY